MKGSPAANPRPRAAAPTRALTLWALALPIVYAPALLIGARSARDLAITVAATGIALLAVRLLAAGRALDGLAARLERPAPMLLGLALAAFAAAGVRNAIAGLAALDNRYGIAALFTQSFWMTLHGRPLFNSAETLDGGLVSHFGVHFSPTLLVITPFFALWPGPVTLMAAQSVALALAAVPLFALLRPRVGGGAALALALALLATPLFAGAGHGDFHDACFLAAPLLAAVWALETRRRGWLAVFTLLTLGVREDTGFAIAMLGVYAVLRGRGLRTALALFAGGLAWFALATRVVIPAFGATDIIADPKIFFASAFGQWGATPGAAIRGVLLHPVAVVRWLTSREIAQYAYTLVLPFLIVPPFLDVAVLVTLPALAINLLSRFPFMHSAHEPYSYLPIAVFLLAVARLAARQAERAPEERRRATGLAAAIVVLAGVLPATLVPRVAPPLEALPRAITHRLIERIPAAAALYAPGALGPSLACRARLDNAWNTTGATKDATFRARYDWIVLWLEDDARDTSMVRALAADPRFEELQGFEPLRVYRKKS